MSEAQRHKTDEEAPVLYEIRLGGRLGPQWAKWFDGLSIRLEENAGTTDAGHSPAGKASVFTLISGPVADQAALFGLLKKVRDLGIPLVSVNPIQSQDRKESIG